MVHGSDQRRSGSTTSVRLEPGSHRSPEDGVCIVELASVLGGERFTDRPRCVCRVVASFLRGWNDRVGYADRQRLYPYASRVVGTGGDRGASRKRRDLCLSWAGVSPDGGPLRRLAGRLRVRARIAWTIGLWPALRLEEGAGTYAARLCFADGGTDRAFALLDKLLEAGGPAVESSPALPAHWVPAELEELRPSNGNGNGNGNGHRREELGIRATIAARERGNPEASPGTRSPAAPGSG